MKVILNQKIIAMVTSLLVVCACSSGEEADQQENSEGYERDQTHQSSTVDSGNSVSSLPGSGGRSFRIKGSLGGRGAGLYLAEESVTHVVATNTETGKSSAAKVDQETGEYELEIDQDSPHVISYVNENGSGEDMLVGSFESEEMNTITATEDDQTLDMGVISIDEDSNTATMSADHGELLEATGVSEETAETVGQWDDASSKVSNPDVDGNGKLDAKEDKAYRLDFHNRFSARTADNEPIRMEDLKNSFPSDDVVLQYIGTGITPEIDSRHLGTLPKSFSWTFDEAVTSSQCIGMENKKLSAGTPCQVNRNQNDSESNSRSLSLQVLTPPQGTYVLQTPTDTFKWTKIKTPDFAEDGAFIALFIKFNVEADKLVGVSHKWMKKSQGTYIQATEKEIELMVKKDSASISLKVDGRDSKKGLGIAVSRKPTGEIDLKTATKDQVFLEGLSKQDLTAGIAWNSVLENPGISYDDKLGMRYFFSIEQ